MIGLGLLWIVTEAWLLYLNWRQAGEIKRLRALALRESETASDALEAPYEYGQD